MRTRYWMVVLCFVLALALLPLVATAQEPPVPDKSQRSDAVGYVYRKEYGRWESPTPSAPWNPIINPPGAGFNAQASRNQDPNASLRAGASEMTMALSRLGSQVVIGWNDAEGFGFKPLSSRMTRHLVSLAMPTRQNGGVSFADGGTPPIGSRIGLGPGPQGRSATGRYITTRRSMVGIGRPAAREILLCQSSRLGGRSEYTPPAGVVVHIGGFQGSNFAWNDSVLVQSPQLS